MDRLKPGCYLKSKVTTKHLKKGNVYEVESVSKSGRYIKPKGIPATYSPNEFTYWSAPDAPQETVRNSKEALAALETFEGTCVNNDDNPGLVVGETYELTQCPSFPDNYKVRRGTNWYSTLKRRFELIHKEKQMLPENWKSYSFNIKNTAQINESLITEDLNWDNPLFIMQVEGEDTVEPFVADEVWTKAANSGKVHKEHSWYETKFEKKLNKLTGDFGERKVPMQDVPKLVKLIQKIKRAKWHDSRKRTVTVKRVQV